MPYPEKTAKPAAKDGAPPTAAGPAPARATVAIAFVQGMLAGLEHAGRDTTALLERAHIPTQVLRDPIKLM